MRTLEPMAFAASYLVVSGLALLLLKGTVLLPLLRWLQRRSGDELELMLALSGKTLIGVGLAMLWHWRRSRAGPPPPPPADRQPSP